PDYPGQIMSCGIPGRGFRPSYNGDRTDWRVFRGSLQGKLCPSMPSPTMPRHPIHWPRVRREWRATMRLALPLIGAQLAAMGTNVVDALLAGHMNAHVQAAVTTGASVWALAILAGIGTMLAVPPTVAQLDGAGRRHEIGAVIRQALWIAAVLGI